MLSVSWQSPDNPFTNAAAVSMFVFMVAADAIWLVLRLESWSQGNRKWFPEGRDFKRLAERQTDASTRRAYTALRYALNTCLLLFFVVPLTLLAIAYLSSHVH